MLRRLLFYLRFAWLVIFGCASPAEPDPLCRLVVTPVLVGADPVVTVPVVNQVCDEREGP
jgi:hypothetical protein